MFLCCSWATSTFSYINFSYFFFSPCVKVVDQVGCQEWMLVNLKHTGRMWVRRGEGGFKVEVTAPRIRSELFLFTMVMDRLTGEVLQDFKGWRAHTWRIDEIGQNTFVATWNLEIAGITGEESNWFWVRKVKSPEKVWKRGEKQVQVGWNDGKCH